MNEAATGDEEAARSRRELIAIGVAIVLALVLGVLAQQGIFEIPLLADVADFVGTLFMRLLTMIIVPLVVTTVISGLSSIDSGRLRRFSLATVSTYVLTTALAVVLGMAFVNAIRPGDGIDLSSAAPPELEAGSVTDVVLSIVPGNVFEAFASSSGLLSVIFFSILLGVAASAAGEPARPFRAFMRSAEQVVMRVTAWILRLTPLGVGALLYHAVREVPPGELARLPVYMATVAGALLAHALITLPLLVLVLGRRNPIALLGAMLPALATALATASSSATLPKTMECAEERAGLNPRVTGFVLPLGATINMDGTALYEAIAAIFVAQAYGLELSLVAQLLIFVTATLAAIGAAGVPSAGLVTMVIVFETVGLPVEGIGLLLAVDRVLDMLRTSVNVWGDACVSAILDTRLDGLAEPDLAGCGDGSRAEGGADVRQ